VSNARDELSETLQDRLAVLNDRIARMRGVNARRGDLFALRLAKQAEVERKQLLDSMPTAAKAGA